MQVMIDLNLAEMYQVEVTRLNEQVKRNLDPFSATFHFQMSNEEINALVATYDRFKTLKHSSSNTP
jgi:ORF6N domain